MADSRTKLSAVPGGILVLIFLVLAVVGNMRRKSFVMATGIGYAVA